MQTRSSIDAQAVGLMLVLCLVWGVQQVALKATAADVAPVFQIALRSGVAAALIALLMAAQGERMTLADGVWRPGLAVGLLFAVEFLCVGEAVRRTEASHVVVFLYTAPIFAALGLHARLRSERLRPLQWAGIALAFAGIVLAFVGHRAAPQRGVSMAGDVLALLAGAGWGGTTVIVRCSRLATLPAKQTLLYQLAVAFVLLLAATYASGQGAFHATPLVWACLVFQCLAVSFASYLAWFWLLRRYVASQLGIFSFLTPLFGVAFGVWLLDESLQSGFAGGAVLVCAGLALVSGQAWLERRRDRRLAAARLPNG
ncbi:MAG: DMT family transporter [Burkholderiales bacterium]|nr:DMT family transporter [Burkholderiales bacterium]